MHGFHQVPHAFSDGYRLVLSHMHTLALQVPAACANDFFLEAISCTYYTFSLRTMSSTLCCARVVRIWWLCTQVLMVWLKHNLPS